VSILYLLIPLAVILMIVAAGFFIWTVKHGQYDDLEGPAHRILMDDDDPLIPGNAPKQQGKTDSASTSGADGEAKQPENRDQGA
jgi:cbb3-type cytochrome oxidase maturation protein